MAYLNLFRQMWRFALGGRFFIPIFYVLHTLATTCELLYPFVFAQIINSDYCFS